LPQCSTFHCGFLCTTVNKNGYACFMASSNSHVASFGPQCFHYTLT
jgi:hypothetical protein